MNNKVCISHTCSTGGKKKHPKMTVTSTLNGRRSKVDPLNYDKLINHPMNDE